MHCYGPSFQGRHTNARAGQDPYSGWTNEGIQTFNALAIANKTARQKPETLALEERFLAELKQELGLVADSAEEERRNKRRKGKNVAPKEYDASLELPDDF